MMQVSKLMQQYQTVGNDSNSETQLKSFELGHLCNQ